MTTGNSTCENTTISRYKTLSQVSEYCLLNTEEKTFLLLDMEWVSDFYEEKDLSEITQLAADIIKQTLSLEELIDVCISEKDTDFVYQLVQPIADCNAIDREVEIEFCRLLEAIYINIQEQIAQALDITGNKKEYKGYNLVGFFRTSAIIAITEQPVIGYPSFKELYGDLRPTPGQAIDLPKDRTKELRDKVFDNTILQTFIPIVSRKCSKVTTLFNH